MRHNDLLDTLQNLTKHRYTQAEISGILGCSLNTISARASRNSKYSLEELDKISKSVGFDVLQEKSKKALLSDDYVHSLASLEVERVKGETVPVDYYPGVFGSCGNGTFVLSENKEEIYIPKKFLPTYAKGKFSVITAYGNSMEPYIYDGDLLVIEQYAGEQIRDNRIYVFRYEDSLYVKRLVKNINQLVIISDNTLYDRVKLDLTQNPDVQVLGKVTAIIRKEV